MVDRDRPVRWPPIIVGLVLAVAAFTVRWIHVDWGLPDVYEEATSVQKAWGFWAWGEKGFDFNPHFFNYPSFYFYLQFLVQALIRAGGELFGAFPDSGAFQAAFYLRPDVFLIASRTLSVLFGAASVLLLFLAGRRLDGWRTSVSAALFLLFHTVHLEKSRFVEVDVPMTFLALLSYLFLLRYMDRGKVRDMLLAGLAVGLAAATKYPGALFLLNLPVAEWLRGGRFRIRTVLLGGLVACAVFSLASPYVLLDPSGFLRDFGTEQLHMKEGHFGGRAEGWVGALRSFAAGFGVPLALLALAGTLLAITRPRGKERLLLPMPILFLFLLVVSRVQVPRYPLPVVPPLALLAAIALDRALPRRLAWGVPLSAASLVLLLFIPVREGWSHHRRLSQDDTRWRAKEWIEKEVRPGALVLLEPNGPQLYSSSERDRFRESAEFRGIRERLMNGFDGRPWYRTAVLPSFSIDTARSARFYHFEPYRWFSYVVLSGDIFKRYQRSPEVFPVQNEFYRLVEREYAEVARFPPGAGSGPEIAVYRRNKPPEPGAGAIRFDRAGASDGEFFRYFRSIGKLYADHGLVRAARSVYLGLLSLRPGDGETLFYLGFLEGRTGNLEQGIRLLQKSVEANEGDRQVRMNLAILLCQAGRLEEGIRLLEKLLEEDEHDAEVHANLGSALLESGRMDEGRRHLELFLELAPNHSRAEDVRGLLSRLSN